MRENAFENIVCEMAAIMSRGRWIDNLQLSFLWGFVFLKHLSTLCFLFRFVMRAFICIPGHGGFIENYKSCPTHPTDTGSFSYDELNRQGIREKTIFLIYHALLVLHHINIDHTGKKRNDK